MFLATETGTSSLGGLVPDPGVGIRISGKGTRAAAYTFPGLACFLPFVDPSGGLVHLAVGDEVSDLGEVGIFLLV